MARYTRLLVGLLNLDIEYRAYVGGGDIDAADNGAIIRKVDARDFCSQLRKEGCVGGAISKDIKGLVIAELDEVNPLAATIGAVNTVLVKSGGRLCGYNTDAEGFRKAVEGAVFRLGVKRATVYGYGGVTAVAVAVLMSLGVKVAIVGRRMEAAAAKAKELGCEVWTKEWRGELFVNAAPVTDQPLSGAANFLPALAGARVAFDHEMPGSFLREFCEENEGMEHIEGVAMYWPQMEAQWRLFLGDWMEHTKFGVDELPRLLREAEEESA
ncbi:hypothetical protein TrRE_jg977 [Triparma retinervis]|uniref:Shikimate dehydrogenase n=1 Tax=Triparma retinervis TaxID=2557542 RepID=A0A9W7G1W3_9STRA|nr:hypothetical protein TrRE_jg977 [Triparma retinervis]